MLALEREADAESTNRVTLIRDPLMSNADVVPMFDKPFEKLLLKKPPRLMDCDSGTDGTTARLQLDRVDPAQRRGARCALGVLQN